ncbi:MAG: XF1762 family protein [Thermoplasmata archaeon]
MKRLIGQWHSTLPPPVGWRVAFLLYGPGEGVVGVSTFGRPVARREDQITTMEHTRMALGPGAAKNSASWFMGATRRWIRQNMPSVRRLIAYVDEIRHSGVTYRADNWRIVYRRLEKADSWSSRPGRDGIGAELRTKFEREP